MNCTKKNKDEIIALANTDNTPKEVLDIYKKNKVSKTIKMSSSLKFCIILSLTRNWKVNSSQANSF